LPITRVERRGEQTGSSAVCFGKGGDGGLKKMVNKLCSNTSKKDGK